MEAALGALLHREGTGVVEMTVIGTGMIGGEEMTVEEVTVVTAETVEVTTTVETVGVTAIVVASGTVTEIERRRGIGIVVTVVTEIEASVRKRNVAGLGLGLARSTVLVASLNLQLRGSPAELYLTCLLLELLIPLQLCWRQQQLPPVLDLLLLFLPQQYQLVPLCNPHHSKQPVTLGEFMLVASPPLQTNNLLPRSSVMLLQPLEAILQVQETLW